jgi:hypothetical protein
MAPHNWKGREYTVKIPLICRNAAIVALLLPAAFGRSATVTGTVTDKTTNRPSAGDTVSLVDVQAGMADIARATTDATGLYSLSTPGMGTYLVRVNHQGAGYFIAAPQGGSPGDVSVYDVAPKVDGVGIDADMLLIEAAGGMLRVHERFLIRNTSLPPKAQLSNDTFEIVIPAGAELDGASVTRPGGMATNTRLVPLAEKGHYTFNIPIQPNQDEKETMFELQYHLSYSGKYSFHPSLQMAADNFVVYLPPGMRFSGAQGAGFQPTQEDPKVQTFIAKSIHSGQAIEFIVSGEGQMQTSSQSSMAAGMPIADAQPGGGIGAPIGSPDPLTSYKGWILGALAVLLFLGAAFLLKRGKLATAGAHIPVEDVIGMTTLPPTSASTAPSSPPRIAGASSRRDLLLDTIKEEFFAIESERLTGALSEDEYARIRTGFEAILKRVLKA